MLADEKIKSGEIGPTTTTNSKPAALPILEGILDVPGNRVVNKHTGPKFVDPSTSMILSSSSSLLRTSLVHFLDSDTSDVDRGIYAPRYQDNPPTQLSDLQKERREGRDFQLAELIHWMPEAVHNAMLAQHKRDEELARKIQEQLDQEPLGGLGGRPMSPRPGSPHGDPPHRTLAPGRSLNDPVPVKVDAEAIEKLRDDVIPFLLKRIEAVEVPAMDFDIDTMLGKMHAFYSDVAVAIEFTPYSKVDISVSREGIRVKIMNIEARMRGAKWGYEQLHLPYLHSSGSLEADALGGDVCMLLTCKQDGALRMLEVEPEVVNIGRVMIKVDGSWSSWVYNTIIGIIKPQIKAGLEVTIESALRQSATAINESLDWLAVLVLAVMHAEEDEAIAAESGFDLMTEGRGRQPHKRNRSSGDLHQGAEPEVPVRPVRSGSQESYDSSRHRRTQSSLQ